MAQALDLAQLAQQVAQLWRDAARLSQLRSVHDRMEELYAALKFLLGPQIQAQLLDRLRRGRLTRSALTEWSRVPFVVYRLREDALKGLEQAGRIRFQSQGRGRPRLWYAVDFGGDAAQPEEPRA